MNGSAGWGDAIVLVPWELYQEYGDVEALAENWPAMVRWLDRVDGWRPARGTPRASSGSAEPLPHERYLWDTGFHWGEWIEPGGEPTDFPAFVAADKADVATAFYAWSTRHAAGIAPAPREGRRGRALRRAQRRGRRRLADGVRRRRRPGHAAHPGQPGPRAAVRAGARRAPPAGGRRPRRAGARGRDAPGHGFPGHAGPAPGARRPRPPRPRLRAAVPGHRAVVADDDRPRRDHRVGALGRHRRRRRAARVAQPLLQGRGDLVPAPVRRRVAAPGTDLAAVPGRADARRRHHLGADRAPVPARPRSRSPGRLPTLSR